VIAFDVSSAVDTVWFEATGAVFSTFTTKIALVEIALSTYPVATVKDRTVLLNEA